MRQHSRKESITHLNHQYQIQELQMYEKSNKKSYEVNFYNTISINHRNVCIC